MLLDFEQATQELDGLTSEWVRVERLNQFVVMPLGPTESLA